VQAGGENTFLSRCLIRPMNQSMMKPAPYIGGCPASTGPEWDEDPGQAGTVSERRGYSDQRWREQ